MYYIYENRVTLLRDYCVKSMRDVMQTARSAILIGDTVHSDRQIRRICER